MSVVSIPSDFEQFEIETPDGTLEFHGKLLGVIDNERRGRPRWAEIELYQYAVTDEDGNMHGQQYLLHTMGHSVVYHRHDGACNRGVTVRADEIPQRAEYPKDLEPCTDTVVRGNVVAKGCYPADWTTVPYGTLFDLEVLRHTRIICPTAEEVVSQLRRPGKRPCTVCGSAGVIAAGVIGAGVPCPSCHGRGYITTGESVLSAPGQRLIEMVRYRDPEIARAVNRTVKL